MAGDTPVLKDIDDAAVDEFHLEESLRFLVGSLYRIVVAGSLLLNLKHGGVGSCDDRCVK